jgi:alkanesulfonate monooxygenase SsuD/methylene tetrahydromethanopterin reductase-like flavin-dependent oxidoreductase (luciferase family)
VAIHEDYDKAREAIEMPAKLLTLNKRILEKYGIKLPEGLSLHKLWMEFTSANTKVINLFKEYVDRIPTEAAERVNAFGTPDDVIESLERFIEVGVRHFVIEFFGPEYWESIRLFSKKVIPYFKRK